MGTPLGDEAQQEAVAVSCPGGHRERLQLRAQEPHQQWLARQGTGAGNGEQKSTQAKSEVQKDP